MKGKRTGAFALATILLLAGCGNQSQIATPETITEVAPNTGGLGRYIEKKYIVQTVLETLII